MKTVNLGEVQLAVAKTIYDIIAEKYPGVELVSPVQGWVYLEEYEKGIECHKNMIQVHTTAYDDRWLGVCYFQLFDDMKATELFYRAIARFDEAARINLAHAFIFTDRSGEVIPEIEKLDFESLSRYDRVLCLRVKSYYYETTGKLEEALTEAEAAWRLVQGVPELPILAPQISNQLGTIYGRLGRANRALWFFDNSLNLLSKGMERDKTVVRMSQLLNILGRYDEAIEKLQTLATNNLPKALSASRLVSLADAVWGDKDVKSAEKYYEEAIVQALSSATIYEEFLGRLSLAAITGSQRLIATASEHLARAKVLISDKPDKLAHQFRDILVSYWAEEFSALETRDMLKPLAQEFSEIGLLLEQGWVRLHIAEMHRQLGDKESMTRELDELQKLAVTLQNNHFLAREWTLVPKLRELALETHPKIAGKSPDVLEIYTMGEEKLVLNGKVVNVRMTKAVELVAYFLEHGKVSLKKMLLDVFADEEPKAARNYFHQFKHELNNRLPGLNIAYDAIERLYSLQTEADILWDVAELRMGRKMGTLGIFLPGSGSEWALLAESELEPLKLRDEIFPVVQINRKVSVKT